MTESVLNKLWEAGGVLGLLCFAQFGAIVYLYKANQAAQKTAQQEHVETLKAVLPMMEKLENTMNTALNVLSRSGGDK